MRPHTPNSSPHRLIALLRDCYEADNRSSAISDLLDDRVRHLQVPLLGWDFVTGRIDRVPLPREAALAAAREAALHRTEKSLVFAALVVVGRAPGAPRRALCAPLLHFPAVVEDAEPNAFLRVDLTERRLNDRLLAALLPNRRAGLAELAERLPDLPFGPLELADLESLLAELLPELDLEPMRSDPRELSLDRLREAASRSRRLRLLPATAVALVPSSPDTREVLDELGRLAEGGPLGPPLEALLGPPAEGSGQSPRPPRPRVPATLSAAQRQVLASAATRPLTVVVGPPGTGKSFTLAAVALDHALRGESVLVATRTDQALDVLEGKLRDLAGGDLLLVRGGRGPRVRELKASLERLLSGLDPTASEVHPGEVRRSAAEVRRLTRRVAGAERRLGRRARLELAWGELDASAAAGGFGALLSRPRLALLELLLGRLPTYPRVMAAYLGDLDRREAAVAALVRATLAARAAHALERHRPDLVALDRAVRARTTRTLARHFSGIDRRALFAALPLWLTTLADVGDLLPLEPGQFDLVVVDEATQCDLASPLPALHRGRRAVVTGDPKQLRHVSFLSESQILQLAERHGVSPHELDGVHFRRRSLLDLVTERVSSQAQVVLLDEHFRSQPRIIAFSNRELYGDRLKVMTQRPETVRHPSLELRRVSGRRDRRGVNREEAERLVDEVVGWVEAERGLAAAHSLGILSPFRDQVDHLTALVSERLSSQEVDRHRLLVGTAHSFQGEERDLMFLSLAVDPRSSPGTTRFLTRPDVFNVAVTRARDLQVVFCSLDPSAVPPGLLRRYLDHVVAAHDAPAPAASPDDPFLVEVAAGLEARGFTVWPAFPVAGREVDLVAERSGSSLGVDLVGQPGRFREPFSLERYRLARRAGLRLLPLPLSAWRRDREACLAEVERWLGPG